MTTDALSKRLGLDRAALAAFCGKWRVAELALFGSVLREDFDETSDVDVLVRFQPDAPWHAWEIMEARHELEALLGREVDLVERVVIERSRNYIRREDILSTAQVIYAA